MIGLVERQEVVKQKIKELLKFIDENELTYCSNELKILVHEIKGLCGLFGYRDLFMLLYEIEKTVLLNNFELFRCEVEKLNQYDLEEIKESDTIISYGNVYKYELCFYFTNIQKFNEIVEILSDCAIIVHSKMCDKKVILYVLSYCDINSMELLCKSYMISIEKCMNYSLQKSGDFIKKIYRDNECFDNNYLHLFLLESITNIARIANKKFKFQYKSNEFVLNNNFLNDCYIAFTELIKNIFSHSGRKNYELITIKCIKKNKYFVINVYNRGNKIKRKNCAHIFENNFSTSEINALAGQGIGLYDVNKLLLSHNGKIYFTNRIRGVSFIIKIPISNYCAKLSNH